MESINLLTPNQLLEGFLPNRYKISEAVKFNDNCNSDCQDDLSEDESDYSIYSDSDSGSDWLDTEIQEVFRDSERPRFDSKALKKYGKKSNKVQ